MASVAVAAVLAGFCMGRLTGGNEVVPETGMEGAGGMEFGRGRKNAGGMESGRDRKRTESMESGLGRKGTDSRTRMAVAGLWGQRDRSAVQNGTARWGHVTMPEDVGMGVSESVEIPGGMDGPGTLEGAGMPAGAVDLGDRGVPGSAGMPAGAVDLGGRDVPGSAGMPAGAVDLGDRGVPGSAGMPAGAVDLGGRGVPGSAGMNRPGNTDKPEGADRWRTSRMSGSTGRMGTVGMPGSTDVPGRNRIVRSHPGLYQIRRGRSRQMAEEESTWSVGSPVSGEVAAVYEGERPAVQILPMEDRLYAPVGGKVIHLFPMGNGLLFRTDFGTELCIQVGNSQDELLGRHYRPRVVKNEIVGKGKVLLQFDRKGLVAEGVSPMVTVSVAACAYGSSARPTSSQWVDSGEEILKVQGMLK